MGDHDDRLARAVEAIEQIEDLRGGDRVEVAGGLVGEDEKGIVGQASGDGHALLLSAGELGGAMFQAIAQPDHVGQLAASLSGVGADPALVVQRNLDVLQHGQLGNEVVRLEDETDAGSADLGEPVVVHLGDVVEPEQDRAGAGSVEASEQVQKRALSRAGGAHDGHVVAFGDVEADAAQGTDDFGAQVVVFGDVLETRSEIHGRLPGLPARVGRSPPDPPGFFRRPPVAAA